MTTGTEATQYFIDLDNKDEYARVRIYPSPCVISVPALGRNLLIHASLILLSNIRVNLELRVPVVINLVRCLITYMHI